MTNIIILGGSYAGISAAHQILKQSSNTTAGTIKITLVTPNTHLYWNLAAPRGILPGQFTDEQIFQPIAPGFEQYGAVKFELILALAENVDTEAKRVMILGSTTGRMSLDYDILILATGSSMKGGAEGIPLKGLGSTEATKDALRKFRSRVEIAKTIVVAGAGVTGCEVAGELGYVYGKQKEIILLASGPTILDGSPSSVSNLTIKELRNLKVEIKLQEKVAASSQLPDGRHELTLSSGHTLVTDIFIPSFGLSPNSSYLDSKFLNANGYVVVDEYLQVKGAGLVWAVGDVSALEGSQYLPSEFQAIHAAKNIILSLSGKTQLVYKPFTNLTVKIFQIGQKKGFGHFGSWKIPGFLVAFGRKRLFTERMVPTVSGSKF